MCVCVFVGRRTEIDVKYHKGYLVNIYISRFVIFSFLGAKMSIFFKVNFV